MALGQDGIRDAIDIFAASQLASGRVNAQLETSAFYRSRHQLMGPRAKGLLRKLKMRDIQFRDLGPRRWGTNDERRGTTWRGNISVNRSFDTEDDVVGLSVLLLHESTHLYLRNTPTLDEEVMIRGLETIYIRELAQGIRFSGSLRTSALRSSSGPITTDDIKIADYRRAKMYQARLRNDQRIDWIMWISRENIAAYRGDLSIAWISRAADWWGGLGRRHPETLGLYLDNILYYYGSNTHSPNLVLRILGAMPGSADRFPVIQHPVGSLDEAIRLMLHFVRGGIEKIRRFFSNVQLTDAQERQLDSIEQRWGRNLRLR